MKIAKIRTSGNPGTETVAMAIANSRGIPVTGYKPKGRECKFDGLKDTPSTREEQSVVWNVRDSHATLILGSQENTYVAEMAYDMAETYRRPNLVSGSSSEIIRWLDGLGDEITLNITGPSEKEDPLSLKRTKTVLSKVLAHFDALYLT